MKNPFCYLVSSFLLQGHFLRLAFKALQGSSNAESEVCSLECQIATEKFSNFVSGSPTPLVEKIIVLSEMLFDV